MTHFRKNMNSDNESNSDESNDPDSNSYESTANDDDITEKQIKEYVSKFVNADQRYTYKQDDNEKYILVKLKAKKNVKIFLLDDEVSEKYPKIRIRIKGRRNINHLDIVIYSGQLNYEESFHIRQNPFTNYDDRNVENINNKLSLECTNTIKKLTVLQIIKAYDLQSGNKDGFNPSNLKITLDTSSCIIDKLQANVILSLNNKSRFKLKFINS